MPPPMKRKKADAGSERTSPTSHAVTEDEYSVVYSKGESVWAYWKDKWFQSKIMGTSSCRHPHDKDRSVPGYKVHYANWGSKYDEWVMSDCLMARSAENDLRAKAENEGRLEKCSARIPKSWTLTEKPGDAVSDGRDLEMLNQPAPGKRLKEEPKKEPKKELKKEPEVEPSRPVTRNGGQKEPARTPESKTQKDVPHEALPKNAQKEAHVEVLEEKPKEEAPASSPEKKMKKDGPVAKTEKKAGVPAAVSQSAKPKKSRADSPEIECLGSGTFTAFHSDIPAEEEEGIPAPVVRTKKTKQVKRLNGSANPVKSKKEGKKEAPKSTKAIPTKPPLKTPAAVKPPVTSKVISRDSSPEISAPPKPPKRLKVDEKKVKDTLTESIAETAAWKSNCTQCTSQQPCKLHAAPAASGYSTKTNVREVMKAAGEASKKVPIYTTKTNGSSIGKSLPVPKTPREATKESAKVDQKLNGSSPGIPSTTSAVTKSVKPKELKLGDKVVAVQVVDTQATTSNSLIGTKQISVNGKQTKLVLKCAPAKREDQLSPRDLVALKSILKTPVKIVTVKSASSSAKGANEQKPKGCVITGTNTQTTASVVIPLHPASPAQLSTPAGQLGTPVTAKSSPTVTTKMTAGKVALPLKAGVAVGRASQVPTVLKKSLAAIVTPLAEVPPAPVVVPVVVDQEEIKRKEKEEKEKERSKQVAAGLISLLAVRANAPNATGMLAKAFQEKMAYADEKLDNVSRASLHHIFVKHIAFGTVCIRKQADERWLLSEEPHMAAVPFLKSLKTYAIQGLNIRLHPSIQSLGVHRQVKLMFDIPETFLQSHSGPNETTCMLLRFCQNSGELPAAERHPRNLVLTLNYGQRLIEDLERGDSSVEQTFKRFCSPVEVPKALLKNQNQLVIEWTDCFDIVDPAKDFLLFVEFAERQSQATILKEIQARKVEIGDTVAKLHSLLTPMNAPGVKEPIQPSMIFTLLCPVTKKRLTIPVRSRACQHNECFDAPAYLAANAASRSAWTCPLCKKIALPEDLVLDEYVELLLRFSAMDKLEVVRDGSTVFVREIDPKRPPKLVPKAVEGAPLSSLSLTQLVPQYRTALSTNGTFVINLQQ